MLSYLNWPGWWTELPGGQIGAELRVLVVGDSWYGDKVKGVIGTISVVTEDARRLNPQVRLRLLASPHAGDLLMSMVTLPAWTQLLQAAGPGNLWLEMVDEPLAVRPDLVLLFWDPRHRRIDLLKLGHDAAARGIATRCFAFTGRRTTGPEPIPSMRASWNGGMDGCPLNCVEDDDAE
jgi:hypothetical protein